MKENGDCFEGEFVRGSRSSGTLTLPSGKIYEGAFEDNQPSGQGKLIVPDKHTYIGTFSNIDGEFTIQGKKVFPDGREEEG